MNYKQMRSVVRGKIIFFIPYLTQADFYWIHNQVGAPKWITELIPLAKSGKIGKIGLSIFQQVVQQQRQQEIWQTLLMQIYTRLNLLRHIHRLI